MNSKYQDAAVRGLNFIRELAVVALLTGTLAFKVSGQTNDGPLEILAPAAANYMNQQVVVRDVVVQVALRPTVALLNLNQPYPDSPLTCVIRGNNTNKFPSLENYLGQRVEISGRITAYQGRPQIILKTTDQIKILNAAPISLQPPPATGEPATKVAADQPATLAPMTAPPSTPTEAKPDHMVWWIVGMLGVIIVMLGLLAWLFWRRDIGNTGARTPHATLARLTAPVNATTAPLATEEWIQRALVAEAMAGRQGQILREKLMPELAEFAKQSLVQGLYAQRNTLIETQRVAQQALVEMESRLAALQLSLPERIRAYEQRIGELEKEVESQVAEVRELTRATLVLVRRKLEAERERERTPSPSRFN